MITCLLSTHSAILNPIQSYRSVFPDIFSPLLSLGLLILLKITYHQDPSNLIITCTTGQKLSVMLRQTLLLSTSSLCSLGRFLKVLVTFGSQQKSKMWKIHILKISSTCKNPGHLSLTAPSIGSLYNNQPHIFPPYYKTNITVVYRTLYSISNHQPTIYS